MQTLHASSHYTAHLHDHAGLIVTTNRRSGGVVLKPDHPQFADYVDAIKTAQKGKIKITIDRDLEMTEKLLIELDSANNKFSNSQIIEHKQIQKNVPFLCNFELGQGYDYYIKYNIIMICTYVLITISQSRYI